MFLYNGEWIIGVYTKMQLGIRPDQVFWPESESLEICPPANVVSAPNTYCVLNSH